MPDVIRVAFTSLAPFVSGAERSLQVTLRHLPAAGVEPVVIGPPGSKIAPWCVRNEVAFLECPLPFRDKWHPLRWWRSVRRMRSLLRNHRIDLVHANQMWSYFTAGAAGRDLGLLRVCHLRDEVAPAALHWCCSTGPEAAICISRHIAQQAEVAWPPGPRRPLIRTRINPVELPPLPDPAEDERLRSEARRSLGVPPEATVFGFIGQVREVKGVLGLLDVLAGLPPGRPWHALIAGRDNDPGAPYERLCRDRAARPDLAGRVQFLGYLEDTAPFYRAIDLAVVPSHEEPMGRVPLEAATFARPSVAYAVGGLPDVIRDGESGWLVPAGDWSALADALDRYLEDPHPGMGRTARAWVEEAADPVRYARWLTDIYHELLGRGTGASDPAHEGLCELS